METSEMNVAIDRTPEPDTSRLTPSDPDRETLLKELEL